MLRILKAVAFVLYLQCLVQPCLGNSDSSPDEKERELAYNLFVTKDSSLTFQEVLDHGNAFLNPAHLNQQTHPKETFWIRLDFKDYLNHLESSSLWYLKFNAFDYATLYYKESNTIVKKSIGKYDFDTSASAIKSDKYFSETSFDPHSLIEGQYLYIKARRVMYFEQLENWKFSFHEDSLENQYHWNDLKKYLPTYLFIGGSAIMALLTLLLFIYLRRWEFLFNCLYVLSLLFYIGKDELLLFFDFGTNNALLWDWAMEDIAITVGIFYQGFMIFYLNLKKDYPFSYRVIQISLPLHLLMLLVDGFFFISQSHLAHIYLIGFQPIIDILTAFLFIANLTYYNKNTITTFFIIGSSIFIVGVTHYFFTQDSSDPLRHYNKLIGTIACSLEILIFSFGLGYKVYSEITEKFRLQKEALIYKAKALRAQMNPHFIFNALSSIQYLIINKKNPVAIDYLGKFSRLARNTLESSFETKATLDEEIKMLKDYLELESLRFDNTFSYNISVDSSLYGSEIEIPFMITQPFVENAIIHGLLPKKALDKKLKVNFRKKENFLECEIDDNGVGRRTAKQRLHIYQKEKKSRGLEVTKQRLESIGAKPENLQIIDKVDNDDNALGTKVIIKIPV
ncbi:MAG: sensor histidine kinase [Allomuricauda sp.]